MILTETVEFHLMNFKMHFWRMKSIMLLWSAADHQIMSQELYGEMMYFYHTLLQNFKVCGGHISELKMQPNNSDKD
jgi:hypothetical protein